MWKMICVEEHFNSICKSMREAVGSTSTVVNKAAVGRDVVTGKRTALAWTIKMIKGFSSQVSLWSATDYRFQAKNVGCIAALVHDLSRCEK